MPTFNKANLKRALYSHEIRERQERRLQALAEMSELIKNDEFLIPPTKLEAELMLALGEKSNNEPRWLSEVETYKLALNNLPWYRRIWIGLTRGY